MDGEAERLANILIRDGWPKSKDDAVKMKAEVEAAQAAVAHSAWLKRVEKAAVELRILTRALHMGAASQRTAIKSVIERIGE